MNKKIIIEVEIKTTANDNTIRQALTDGITHWMHHAGITSPKGTDVVQIEIESLTDES